METTNPGAFLFVLANPIGLQEVIPDQVSHEQVSKAYHLATSFGRLYFQP
jgi:hypothetical protein